MLDRTIFVITIAITALGSVHARIGGGGGRPPVPTRFDSNDAMIHWPIVLQINDPVYGDFVDNDGNWSPADPSPLWGRNAPKIAHVGEYCDTVVLCSL
ncbi:MAG: hypothetical protein DYG94_06815 [Leptolyngbya sp. PLA3]|nr:MAG: hypothetical protein EDM82_06160 [Cyanobacteria bacterium CYA]MCE7968440.1 hypothetical protein [Leptolyngbya sp. PL-A3]